jgi:hypothetical protein
VAALTGSLGAVITRPAAPTPDCVAHYRTISELITTQPELVAMLERAPDPLDRSCISTAAIARAIAASLHEPRRGG